MKVLLPDKVNHMRGVAEYMFVNADKYGLDPDKMYTLGLLHDIGYIHNKDGHAGYGAELLNSLGFIYGDIVSWHGTSPKAYMMLNETQEIPKELILLWEADLSVSPKGEYIGFDARLKDIGHRYGYNSKQYNIAKETVEWLRKKRLNF